MSARLAVFIDGERVRHHRELPPAWRGFVRRRKRLVRRTRAGVFFGTTAAAFVPVLRIYTTGTGATETIPFSAGTVVIEVWGSGGGSQGGTGTGCSANNGNLAGCGGYCRTSIAVGAQNNKTFTYTAPAGGAAGGTSGGAGGAGATGSCSGGTFTGLTAMSATGGGAGSATTGAGGTGTGGTQANQTGATGSSTGITGTVSGDGSPYGAGGLVSGLGSTHAGHVGQSGAVVFFYT